MNSKIEQFLDAKKNLVAIEKLVEDEKKIIEEQISKISIEDLKDLDYATLKDLYSSMYHCYAATFENIKEDFLILLKKKKIELYPALLKPYHFPQLNDMEIPLEIALSLDESLYNISVNHSIHPDSTQWKPYLKYLDILVDNGIIEKYLRISCPNYNCDEVVLCIKDAKFKKYIECMTLGNKLREKGKDSLSQKEYDYFIELDNEGYYYLELSCMECDYYKELTSLDELNKLNYSTYYQRIASPDTTYDSL